VCVCVCVCVRWWVDGVRGRVLHGCCMVLHGQGGDLMPSPLLALSWCRATNMSSVMSQCAMPASSSITSGTTNAMADMLAPSAGNPAALLQPASTRSNSTQSRDKREIGRCEFQNRTNQGKK
jgi:hypothetical protein